VATTPSNFWQEHIKEVPESKRDWVTETIKSGQWFDGPNGRAHPEFGGTIHSIKKWTGYPAKPSACPVLQLATEYLDTTPSAITTTSHANEDYEEILVRFKNGSPPDAWFDPYHVYEPNADLQRTGYDWSVTPTTTTFENKMRGALTRCTGIPPSAMPNLRVIEQDGNIGTANDREGVGDDYLYGDPLLTAGLWVALHYRGFAYPANFEDVLLQLYINSPAGVEAIELAKVEEEAKDVQDQANKGNWHGGGKIEGSGELALVNKGTQDLLDCIKNKTCTAAEARAELETLKDGELRRERIKYNAQCVLSGPFNINNFSRANVEYRYDQFKYGDYEKMFFVYGDPTRLMSLLTTPPGTESFIDIKTSEVAELVPTIRLYKVYRDLKGKYTGEVEFNFDNYGTVHLQDNVQERILSGFNGVGIKSFDWQLNATNPATVRNDISAKLVLYFQSFNDLLRKRDGLESISGENRPWSYEELLIRQPMDVINEEKKDPKGKTISTPGTAEIPCVMADLYYDPQYYEIKVVVGWAYTPTVGSLIRDKDLQDACGHQKMTMFLTLVEHEFNFEQEGTFSLSIKYRGRLEGLANDPRTDVLLDPMSKRQVAQLEEELSNLRSGCVTTDAQKEAKEANVTQKEEEIEVVREAYRDKFAQYLLDGFQDKIYVWSVDRIKLGKIRYSTKAGARGGSFWRGPGPIVNRQTNINQDIILPFSDITAMIKNPQAMVAEAVALTYADGAYALDVQESAVLEPVTEIVTGQASDQEESGGLFGSMFNMFADEPNVEGDTNKVQTATMNGIHIADRDVVHVPWFYLGDLINMAATYAFSHKNVDTEGGFSQAAINRIRFILGPIPLKTVTHLGVTGDRTTIRNICLGDIPITLQTFKDWYIERIQNAQRTTYPILEFARDVIQDLALVALRPICDELGIEQDIRIKTAQVSLPAFLGSEESSKKHGDRTYRDPLRTHLLMQNTLQGWRKDTMSACYLDLESFSKDEFDLIRAVSGRPENSTMDSSYHYFVIYAENAESQTLRGNYNDDKEKGIYHMMLGADRGLVKQVNFQKNNAPYLREARFQQDALNPLSQLAATYNCDMSLIGNTIFWPGQYVFVNPIGYGSGLGLPADKGSISNQLGLGGYHLVTKVSSFIEAGKYETKVTALFESSGDGCKRTPNQIDKGPCAESEGSPQPHKKAT
jgi:hypothetical protein